MCGGRGRNLREVETTFAISLCFYCFQNFSFYPPPGGLDIPPFRYERPTIPQARTFLGSPDRGRSFYRDEMCPKRNSRFIYPPFYPPCRATMIGPEWRPQGCRMRACGSSVRSTCAIRILKGPPQNLQDTKNRKVSDLGKKFALTRKKNPKNIPLFFRLTREKCKNFGRQASDG